MLKYKNNLVALNEIDIIGDEYKMITAVNLDTLSVSISIKKNGEEIYSFFDLEDYFSIFYSHVNKEWKKISRSNPSPEKFQQFEQLKNETYMHYIYSFAILVDAARLKGMDNRFLKKEYPYTVKRFSDYIGK